jgi:carboxyl-terminal processing protease
MQPKHFKLLQISFLIFSILFVFSAGVFSGILIDPLRNLPAAALKSREIDEEQIHYLNQVWEIVHTQFINQPIDDEKLLRGAIRGMMDSLDDPYSAYMSPEEFRSQSAPINGEYSGIGAHVDISGDLLIILAPMPDSPAELAGLRAGDKVIEIDGQDMTKLKPVDVLERIYGPEGTKIGLSIQREGIEDILKFEMERALIQIPSVDGEMLDGDIGIIRLYTFGENSTREFKKILNTLLDQEPIGLIIDLRNNTGGLVNTAIEITSLFISEGVVMIEELGDGSRKEFRTTGIPVDAEIPLVVLVNGGTASASEITAGALQDHARAIIVGTQTFGKGYIQNWVPLHNENGALRLTIARWLTPKGRKIQELGLTPDYQIQITDQDIKNKVDSQMNQAITLLRFKSKK